MSTESLIYLGFADGANHHTQNLALDAWVIYVLDGHLVSSGGVYHQPSSNNIVEYSAMFKLLTDAISNGIRYLEFLLDSQLVVS